MLEREEINSLHEGIRIICVGKFYSGIFHLLLKRDPFEYYRKLLNVFECAWGSEEK